MKFRTTTKTRFTIIGILSLLMLALMVPATASADALTICPEKIVLNAKGQFEDVQAVIRMAMTSGYTLSDYNVTLSFDGVVVSEAYFMRYCYIDDNFLASFDRPALQANPTVIAMENSFVGATVEGWYEATNSDGESYRHDFSYTTMVQIVDPDKK